MREAVTPGEEAERGKLGVGKGRGEAIVALRQRAREHACQERRTRGPIPAAGAEQDAANTAGTARQEQNRPILWLPALCLDPAPLGFGQFLENRVVLGGDEADGDAFGARIEKLVCKRAAYRLERHGFVGHRR